MARKIHSSIENPIDNILINICEHLCPHLKKLNFTPNMLTTIGLMLGIISIMFLYKNMYTLSIIFLWLCYFFDCLDGHYARMYDMCTDFGDYYDHIRDIIVSICILVLIFIKLKSLRNRLYFTVIILVFGCLLGSHMGCQELSSDFKHVNSSSLSMTKTMCIHPELIHCTRFFGCASFVLLMSFFIVSVNYV